MTGGGGRKKFISYRPIFNFFQRVLGRPLKEVMPQADVIDSVRSSKVENNLKPRIVDNG